MSADPALDRAYRRAIYRVQLADRPLDLRIGEPSAELARLLGSYRAHGAAFLTACNPGSQPADPLANQAAQAALLDAAARLRCPTLPGLAIDPDGRWPDEESVLVLGLDAATATSLAHRFGQNALVWIGADAEPELIWVR